METIYRAIDGTEFTNKQDCISYEKQPSLLNYQENHKFGYDIEKIEKYLQGLYNQRFEYKQTELPNADRLVKKCKEQVLMFLKKAKKQGIKRTIRNRKALKDVSYYFGTYDSAVLKLNIMVNNYYCLIEKIKTEEAKLFKLKSDYKNWLKSKQTKELDK